MKTASKERPLQWICNQYKKGNIARKKFTGKLLRIVYESDQFSDIVYSLANHPFMRLTL